MIQVMSFALMICFFVATPFLNATSAYDVFEYYQDNVFEKGSGVYEYNGYLYVQEVVEYNKHSSDAKLQAEGIATFGVHHKIKEWMWMYVKPLRDKDVNISEGIKFTKARLDEISPTWQIETFDIAFNLQILNNDGSDGRYVVCLCALKDLVIENIPSSFYEPCSAETVMSAIQSRARRLLSGPNREKFLSYCGAFDLLGVNVSSGNKDAYLAVNEKIRKHLEESELAKELKQAIIDAEKPQVTVKEVEEVNEAKTLSIKRVETVTVTRNPRMQKLFLNWETEENFPLPTTSLGETTKKNLFRGKTSVVDSIQQLKTALIENPGDKELWNYLGRKLMDNGEPLLAIIAYRNALKLDPAFIYPMVNLANAYLAIDQYDLAFGLATALQGMELDSWSAKESVRILQTDCE
jgi:tetratricopeptide (TPR) repeat protein